MLDPDQGGELGLGQTALLKLIQQGLLSGPGRAHPPARVGLEKFWRLFRRCHSPYALTPLLQSSSGPTGDAYL